MRITSSLWVSAYCRTCEVNGAYAMVSRKGMDQAGAIFVLVNLLDGQADLYIPAPQSAYDADNRFERLFELRFSQTDISDVEKYIKSECRFDSDLWVVEIEDKKGQIHFEIV